MSKIQAIRGMNDQLPEESAVWQYLESKVASCLQSYGFQEIRFPILEKTELFKRTIGEATDIVEKEMYTFLDRNQESLTLRPEGTASCVRACEQHGLLYNQIQKLWYAGPMFRYERPQKGRMRQFHQIGAEVFGLHGPDIDAELLLMTARLWRDLGIADALTLEINSLGTAQARKAFREALITYLATVKEQLDDDSKRRLKTNPLRILDSKSESTQALLENAPTLLNFMDEETRQHFERLTAILDQAGLTYTINHRLVRGLDYYGYTVFEWKTEALGAQGTICGGGRYNALVEQLGGKPTPAAGFAMGIERLILMLRTLGNIPEDVASTADIYILSVGDVQPYAMAFAEQLREQCHDLRCLMHCGGGSFKSQMKKADKSQAKIALIIGEDEASQQTITIKHLRQQQVQQSLALADAIQYITTLTF